MLPQLEKAVVPHNVGAREATKHPPGRGSAAGGAERWIHYPTEITSPKSIKMLVFKKKSAFPSHFCCHLSVKDRESFVFL